MRRLFFLLSLGLLSGALFASPVSIKLSGNQDPACTSDFICITESSFPLTTSSDGGGYSQFLNELSGPITELNFDMEYADSNCPTGTPAAVSLNLDPSFFAFATTGLAISSSSKCTQQAGIAEYLLSLNFTPGVPDSYLFQINLNSDPNNVDPEGEGSWLPDSTFIVNTVPEPRTYALFAGGLIAIAAWARRRRVA